VETYLTKLYAKQISLTEWFEAIGDPRAAKLREEDAHKHDRLDVLNTVIGLPFGKPTRFSAEAVASRSPELKTFVADHGQEECAIRLIPRRPDAPKLRMRGYTIAKALDWFDEQKIKPADYDVDFVPHDHPKWATILTVTDKGIFGEIKRGDPSQLTQGMYKESDEPPTTFAFDFKTWHFSNDLPGAEAHLKKLISKLRVADPHVQQELAKKLQAAFAHNYLKGYFETSTSDEYGTWFIDYNRLLGDIYEVTPARGNTQGALVTGRTGSPGVATGIVRIVAADQIEKTTLTKNDVLVCVMTSPDYLPLMQQASAIVTDLGGVLSHAAIIARELKKPCLTGTKNATTILKDGQKIVVDASNGVVRAA
jgi:phosphohistidine swiveling domain-containing protein